MKRDISHNEEKYLTLWREISHAMKRDISHNEERDLTQWREISLTMNRDLTQWREISHTMKRPLSCPTADLNCLNKPTRIHACSLALHSLYCLTDMFTEIWHRRYFMLREHTHWRGRNQTTPYTENGGFRLPRYSEISVMWIRIRIQRYKITDKMKGKAEFNQQKSFFFAGNYIFQVWT